MKKRIELVNRLGEKACVILRDGKVHGKPLTEKQRRYFGLLCGLHRRSAKVSGKGRSVR
mgnify:CR=1 FL=1